MTDRFTLTELESSLVNNSEWIRAKLRIIDKVYDLFGRLSEHYQHILAGAAALPEEVKNVSPKIYKGERYHDLPYVMLDDPRFFQKEDVFAIRSLFWWGNHFSIHLVLGGRFRTDFAEKVAAASRKGFLANWYAAVPQEPWEHHFEPENYRPVDRHHFKDPLPGGYLKLGRWHPLSQWTDAEDFFQTSFRQLIEVIN